MRSWMPAFAGMTGQIGQFELLVLAVSTLLNDPFYGVHSKQGSYFIDKLGCCQEFIQNPPPTSHSGPKTHFT
jgi:hypothetical protein